LQQSSIGSYILGEGALNVAEYEKFAICQFQLVHHIFAVIQDGNTVTVDHC